MKKMILLVSMLAGIMTFSGCVDDKESPSVTAVRQAKAAQLTALAALSNAQAAQAQALADTENAVREAKVAYEQARAAYQQAIADKAKAEAEEAMAKAQQVIQDYANQLEKMAIQQKIDMLDLQTQYNNALKDADDATATLLGGLFTAYSGAADNLLAARQRLAKANVELAQLQAGLVNGEEAKQMAINGQNRIIADNEEIIANQKAMLEIYEAQKAPAEAKAELTAAQNELSTLQQAQNDALKAVIKAREDLDDAVDLFNDQAYKKLAQKIAYNQFSSFVDEDGNSTGESFDDFVSLNSGPAQIESKDVPETVDTYWFSTTDDKGVTTYTAVMTKLIYKQVTKSESVDGAEVFNMTYPQYTSYYQLNEAGVKAYIAAINAKVTAEEGKALKAAQAALTAQQAEITKLEAATPKDEAAIEAAKAQLPSLRENVNLAQADLDKANAQVAAIQACFDEMKAETENWTAAVNGYNATYENLANVIYAYQTAEEAVELQKSKIKALQAVVDGSVFIDGTQYTVAAAIEYAEGKIKTANQNIANAQKQIATIQNQNNYNDITQQAIELKEQEIANLEAQIPVLQAIADKAKAALDAALEAMGE